MATSKFNSCRRFAIHHAVAVSLALSLTCSVRVRAQTDQEAKLIESAVYDVASIRPVELKGGMFQMVIPRAVHAGDFHASGVTVKKLIQLAWDVQGDQIQGGPLWIGSELFTVTAKADPSLDLELRQMSDANATLARRHMLQALLEDRFNLRVERAEGTGSVYVLTQERGGVKLRASESPEPEVGAPVRDTLSIQMDGDTMICRQTPIGRLVMLLSDTLQTPIVDKTGLTGRYDFALRFRRPGPGDDTSEEGSRTPAIEDALSEQLGLKLSHEKGPIEELRIVAVTKPTPN